MSTLAHGCEETTCYLLFADRHRERSRIVVGPFLLDTYHQDAFCYIIKNVQNIAPSLSCKILTALIPPTKTTAMRGAVLEIAML